LKRGYKEREGRREIDMQRGIDKREVQKERQRIKEVKER